MKKIAALILLIGISDFVSAHQFTSVLAGGNWSAPATWTGGPSGSYPGNTDTATIASSVTVDATTRQVRRITINSGQTLTMNYSLYVWGEIINNGAIWDNYQAVILWGSNMTVLEGRGSWNGPGGAQIDVYGAGEVFDSTVFLGGVCNIIIVDPYGAGSVINKGHVAVGNGYYLTNESGYPFSWTNAKNSFLRVTYWGGSFKPLANSYDTLHASAPGDTVYFYAVNATYSIKQPVGNQFNDLYLNKYGTGTISIPSNFTVNLLDVVSTGIVNMNGYNVNISGNWADYGSISNNTGTVTFDAKGSQCVLRTSGTEAFKNITITRTSKLGSNCTVSASGTVYLQPGGSMDCTCP